MKLAMKVLEGYRQLIAEASLQCVDCGKCIEVCEHMEACGDSFGNILAATREGRFEDQLTDFISKCALCGLCDQYCPEKIPISKLIKEIRSSFVESKIIDKQKYRPLWMDHDWNAHTLYLQAFGLNKIYQEYAKEKCNVLFFPGCMLVKADYKLVKAAVKWLQKSEDNVGVSLKCCGVPLSLIGLKKRHAVYVDTLSKKIMASGAYRIVTACPGCHDQLTDMSVTKGVEVISIFQLMAEAGLELENDRLHPLTIHDSCMDRRGTIGGYVRKLVGKRSIEEMEHHGSRTVCCGAGGMVFVADPKLSYARTKKRVKEISETNAEICLTYCMGCASRLAQASERQEIRHVLELLLNQQVDYVDFQARSDSLFQGKAAEENVKLIRQSKLIGL